MAIAYYDRGSLLESMGDADDLVGVISNLHWFCILTLQRCSQD